MRSFANAVVSIARGLCLRGVFASIFTITFTVYFAFAMSLSGCGGGSTGGGVQESTQTITFAQPISPVVYASGLTITLSATGGGSGNPIIFTVDASSTGKGTVSGNTLTVTAAGNLVIDANQAGNSNYYAASQVQVTIVVNAAAKITPTISAVPTAGAITSGQTLAASILAGGTASVPGSFAWTTPSTVPPTGNDSESVTFTPTDTTDYTTAQASVQIVVNPAAKTTPTISAVPTASAITSGQALSASTLTGGTASVPGSFAWTTPSTVPATGTDSESVTFTPTDTTDYTTATANVQIVVGKATPTISAVPTASAITEGATLSTSTLTGGTASVPGTFAWTTPSTVPATGTNSESVTFTPTDTTDYTTATANVQLVVNPATPMITSAAPRYFVADGFSYFIPYEFGCVGCVNGDIFHDASGLFPDVTLSLASGATGFGITTQWEQGTFEPWFVNNEIQHPGGSYGNQWGTASMGTGSQSTIVESPTTGTIFQLEGINGVHALTTGGTQNLIVRGLSTSPWTIAVDDGGDLVVAAEMAPTPPVIVSDETGTQLCRFNSGMASLSSVSARSGNIFFTDPVENKMGIARTDCSGYQTVPIAGSPWVVSATSTAAYVLSRDKASVNGLPLVTKKSFAGVTEGSVELTGFTPVSTVRAANPYQGLYSLVASSSAPMAEALSTSDNSVLIINTDSMTISNAIKIPADEIPFQVVLQESPLELFVGYILANSGESLTHIGSVNLATGDYNPDAGVCAQGILANILAINDEAICAQGGVIEPPVALHP